MSTNEREIIGKNVRAIRKKLGLSINKFGLLIELSDASIVNIESGKPTYSLTLLESIANFTRYSIKTFKNPAFNPSDDIRDRLIKTYANVDKYHTILNKAPEIAYAITYKALKTNFLDQPKEISEIRAFLMQYNWVYRGNSIATALKRMPESIKIEVHPTKKRTYIYSKK